MTTGRKSKMYYSVGGAETPIWLEITPVGDVDNPDAKDEIAVDTRESDYTKYETGQRKVEVNFNIKLKNNEAAFAALSTAYENDAIIGIANYIGDMADSGARGTQMDVKIFSFPKTLPLNDHVNSQMVLKPAYGSDFEPVTMQTA